MSRRMAAELGQAVDIHGDVRHAFPGPARLASLQGFPRLFDRKVENLRALGVEAMDGRLDGAWLRSLPRAQALEALKLRDLLETETGEIRGTGTRGVGGRPGT